MTPKTQGLAPGQRVLDAMIAEMQPVSDQIFWDAIIHGVGRAKIDENGRLVRLEPPYLERVPS